MSELLTPPPVKITADDVRAAMQKRWGARDTNGRTAVLFEVGNSTGFARNRSADALIMWCWPSDGLELHGVEIKVARSDWMHELRQPKKADDIAKYCDRWWLFTGPGVVRDVDELPPAWGWRLWDGRIWKTMKEAAVTAAEPINRAFLGSVLRNAGQVSDAVVERARREAREAIDDEVKRRVDDRLRARSTDKVAVLMEAVAAFEAATGIELHREESYGWLTTHDGRKIGQMVAALRGSSLDGSDWARTSMAHLVASLSQSLLACRDASAAMGIELPPTPKTKRQKR